MIPYSKKLVSKANAAKKYDTRRKAFAISRLLNYCDLKHMRETPHPSAFGCHLLPLEKAGKMPSFLKIKSRISTLGRTSSIQSALMCLISLLQWEKVAAAG